MNGGAGGSGAAPPGDLASSVCTGASLELWAPFAVEAAREDGVMEFANPVAAVILDGLAVLVQVLG